MVKKGIRKLDLANPTASKVRFGDRFIGEDSPVLIIAEIGINHEGDPAVCEEMVKAAARSGADSIKLQTIDPDENYVVGTESYSIFSKSMLTKDQTEKMFDLSRKLDLEPFTTAGDFATIDWVDKLEPSGHKISSGLFTNIPIIQHAARKMRPLIMSTGMAGYDEIDEAVQAAKDSNNNNLALFQCTSRYPAPYSSLNLATISALENRYGFPAGFSDHSIGTDAAFLSVGAGAKMIEKHFTFDTTRPNYDHRISLDPDGFALLVRSVRNAEEMLGKADKNIDAWEQESASKMHRILVARRFIKKGEKLTEENVGIKRPINAQGGLAPKFYERILGHTVTKDLDLDATITENHLAEPLQ